MQNLILIIKNIIAVLRYMPELFSLVSKFIGLIKNAIDEAERKKLNEKFNNALEKSKETKNTSEIEDLFGNQEVKTVLIEEKVIKPVSGFDIKFIEPKKEEKINVGNVSFKMSFAAPSSSVIINPTVNPTTPRNVNQIGYGMGGSMGSKFLSIAILFTFLGCRSQDKLPGENAPSYKPKIYAGDSLNGGITRKQSNEFISANDPEFDNYLAVSANTMSCIFQTYVNNCEKFKKQVVQCKPVNSEQVKSEIERIENL